MLRVQNITPPASCFAVTKTLLCGNALTAFGTAEATYVAQTMSHYKQCLDDVTVHVFPGKAYKRQKRYMDTGLYKPRATPTKAWVGRILKLKNYFK